MIPKKEQHSEYDGPLSYVVEWHMAIVGAFFGFIVGYSKTLRREFAKEPQYVLGFSLVAWFVGYYLSKRGEDCE